MGVHRTTSEAARVYAERERILGNGIILLGAASESLASIDKPTLERIGNLSSALLPYSPGYAGKLMLIISRLFLTLAGAKEKEHRLPALEELEKEIKELQEKMP
jgi:hypothetical protein